MTDFKDIINISSYQPPRIYSTLPKDLESMTNLGFAAIHLRRYIPDDTDDIPRIRSLYVEASGLNYVHTIQPPTKGFIKAVDHFLRMYDLRLVIHDYNSNREIISGDLYKQ